MFKLYSNYISASFILPFLVSTTFFITFLMTFELFRIMSLMASDEISMTFIFGLIFDVMTTLVPVAVPLSIFFSTIFCLSRMSADSEYIALRAAGLEKRQIFTPFLVMSLLVSLVIYSFNQQLVPNAHKAVRSKIQQISSESLIQGIKSGQFFTKIKNITIFPTYVDAKSKEFEDIFLHIFDSGDLSNRVIVAKSGKILHKKDEKTGIESFKLYLENGNILNKSSDAKDIEKILFKDYTLPISQQRFSYKTFLKEIMMNKDELSNFLDGGFQEAKKRGYNKKEFRNAKFEYWQRINTPVLCVLLTFLGFGLGVSSNRGKNKNSSSKGILILIGYYVIYFSLISFSKSNNIPIYIAMIIPGLVLAYLGTRYYKAMDWLS